MLEEYLAMRKNDPGFESAYPVVAAGMKSAAAMRGPSRAGGGPGSPAAGGEGAVRQHRQPPGEIGLTPPAGDGEPGDQVRGQQRPQ